MNPIGPTRTAISTMPAKSPDKNPLSVAHKLAKMSLEMRADLITKGLEQYLIPVAIAQKVVDHAVKFQCDHPRWKPEKAVRKTVDYFKLKKKERK